jgi:HD-GYP domain-containing protein (c-di-GMP phosphodiesterase class II)
MFDTLEDGRFDVVLCGPLLTEVSPREQAQAYRAKAPSAKIIFLTTIANQIAFKDLVKNGFDEVFVLPADETLCGTALRAFQPPGVIQRPHYRSVPVTDFEPGHTVDFTVAIHLPMNDRHVVLVKPGASIEAKQLDRFRRFEVHTLSVPETDLEKFVNYSAAQLKKLRSDGSTNIEAKKKLETNVRNLFRDLISADPAGFDEGKSLIETSQKIVSEFLSIEKVQDVQNRLAQSLSALDSGLYSHCARVSSVAALLCIGAELGSATDAAIAGLFHDLGKMRLPQRLQTLPAEQMNAEERAVFETFPGETITVLQEKKIGITTKTRAIITQQGERADGRGYPKQLPEHKIEPEVFALHVANELDELMTPRPGQPRLKIEAALERVAATGAVPAATMNAIRRFVFPAAEPAQALS